MVVGVVVLGSAHDEGARVETQGVGDAPERGASQEPEAQPRENTTKQQASPDRARRALEQLHEGCAHAKEPSK